MRSNLYNVEEIWDYDKLISVKEDKEKMLECGGSSTRPIIPWRQEENTHMDISKKWPEILKDITIYNSVVKEKMREKDIQIKILEERLKEIQEKYREIQDIFAKKILKLSFLMGGLTVGCWIIMFLVFK